MTQPQPEQNGLWIESIRDNDGEPVCQLTWGPWQGYASVTDVRQTALDLHTCAAYAEMMMQLVEVGLPPLQTAAFVGDLLVKRKKRYFGTGNTVYLMPAGSSKKKQALVLLNRAPFKGKATDDGGAIADSMRGMLFPDEARQMAQDWMAVAEATESDQLLTRALPLAMRDAADGFHYELDHDSLFDTLRKMRGQEGPS